MKTKTKRKKCPCDDLGAFYNDSSWNRDRSVDENTKIAVEVTIEEAIALLEAGHPVHDIDGDCVGSAATWDSLPKGQRERFQIDYGVLAGAYQLASGSSWYGVDNDEGHLIRFKLYGDVNHMTVITEADIQAAIQSIMNTSNQETS